MSWAKNKSRGNPHGRTKVEHAGYSFASKLEASVFSILKLMERAGQITGIEVQPTVYLTDADIGYRPDFRAIDLSTANKGNEFFIEAKGFPTPEWKIKKRLWEYYGPGELWIYVGSYKNPKLDEIVKPKVKKL